MKNLTLSTLFLLMCSVVFAQEFNVEMSGFSKKKITYITMENMDKMEINPSRIKFKKGLIEEVIYKNEAGEKVSVPIEDIKEMYIPFSDLAKLGATLTTLTNMKKMANSDIKTDILEKGYAYFVKSDVMIKKKKQRTLLMQSLNPAFGSKIMVFMDPYAAETGGLAVGDIQMTGGDSKSYYIKVGDEVAYRLYKKDYKDAFDDLFGDCKKMKKEFKKIKWADFAKHVYYYETECN